MNFETCKKIVEAGSSKVFENWKALAPITKEDFLDALKWICKDPEDGGANGDKMTREVGLTPNGIVKLKRAYGIDDTCAFYKQDGRRWEGAVFYVPCDNPDFADGDGKVATNLTLSVSCRDRI